MKTDNKIKLYIEFDSKHTDKKVFYFVDILKNNQQIEMVDCVELCDSYFIIRYGSHNPWNQSKSRISPTGIARSTISFYAFYNHFCDAYKLYNEFDINEYVNLLKLSNSSDRDSRLLALNLWSKLEPSLIMNLGLYLISRHGKKDERALEISKALENLLTHNHKSLRYDGLTLDSYYETIKSLNSNQKYLQVLNDESIQQLFIQKYSRFLNIPRISLIGLENDQVQSSYDKSQITKEFGI